MPDREIRALAWITTILPECPTIGIVASVDHEAGEWTAYIGAGAGLNEAADAARIVLGGGPLSEAMARAADADGRFAALRYRR